VLQADVQRRDEALVVVQLGGEIDVSNAAELFDRLDAEAPWAGTVVVNLHELRFCDSSGLRAFLRCHEAAEQAGGRFVLQEPSDLLRRTLTVTGLTEKLSIEDTP
jgi:anti-anti-sigma factor